MEIIEILRELKELEDVPTIEDEDYGSCIDTPFKEYPRGTQVFEIWHDYEASNPEFIMGEYLQGAYNGIELR